MPSEHCIVLDAAHSEQPTPPPQIKLCSSCSRQLSPESIVLLHPEADIVCTPCLERICALFADVPERPRDAVDGRSPLPDSVDDFAAPCLDEDVPMPFRTASPPPAPPAFASALVSPSSPIAVSHQRHQFSPPTSPSSSSACHTIPPHASSSFADPYTDITRLRVRSHSQDCLYPGAQFSGTQKSGRSSYEVSVTIVDVDFTSSFLCGYLRIRGLTDDWPELTTYFDAQIIGSRYGFLTDDWGADEQDDMTHWARFPAFQKVRQDIRGPHHTIRDRDRDCVFMRWKERFLVPDHRVRDINGASFAGFYYVCVEFNPQNGSISKPHTEEEPPPLTTDLSSSKPDSACPQPLPSAPTSPGPAPRRQWTDGAGAWEEEAHPSHQMGQGAATMSGFYFHQNSEPYQQLSLRHVPQESTGSFEFR